MTRKRKLLQLINLFRLIPAWLIVQFQPSNKKELIIDEMKYWNKCAKLGCDRPFDIFSTLLISTKEYRNLLAYRMSGGGYSRLLKLLFRPMETLYINCRNIGPRLYIQHGFATYITAKSIGSNCWINQQVTIGYTFDPEPPIIGNGVRISAGAKVIGQITVGDNAIIAANAAVVKDVPENAVVGGVPAKIIGENTQHKLFLYNEVK